jgi:hypothetical protein
LVSIGYQVANLTGAATSITYVPATLATGALFTPNVNQLATTTTTNVPTLLATAISTPESAATINAAIAKARAAGENWLYAASSAGPLAIGYIGSIS